MKLGNLELQRRPVDILHAVALRRATSLTGEPHTTLLTLAALGLSCSGPVDWPLYDERFQDFMGFGRVVREYLSIRGLDMREAVLLGSYALRSAIQAPDIDTEKANRYADFFGLPPDFSPGSDLPDNTRGARSED